MTSLEIFAADLHGHGRRETFNPVRQKLMSAPPPQTESGQSGAEPLTGLRTPSKSTEGIYISYKDDPHSRSLIAISLKPH